jgi:hypothetical protein
MRHVVWNRNGTLVADLAATVEAVNPDETVLRTCLLSARGIHRLGQGCVEQLATVE